ncbi:MAG: MMPL family transporter [Phycisphaerales bacterium]
MVFKRRIAEFSLDRYRQVTLALAAFTLICAAFVPWIKVDAAVESMFPERDAVRIFHEQAGRDFAFAHDEKLAASAYDAIALVAVAVFVSMLTVFILKRRLFRNLVLVLVPMTIASATTLVTMGMLAALRFPLHRIDTMIPIFLMPISAVGSVHILSEFLERYTREKGRRQAAVEAIRDLFRPTLGASLTVAAGFALLKWTPSPPVQAFGLFVAAGIMIAWAFTIISVPASVMFLSEATLEKEQVWPIFARAKPAAAAIVIPIAVLAWGITRVTAHSAPRADAGSRTAYLVLEDSSDPNVTVEFIKDLRERLRGKIEELAVSMPQARDALEPTDRVLVDAATNKITKAAFLANLSDYAGRQQISTTQDVAPVWCELTRFFDSEGRQLKLFQQPEMLRYVAGLVDHIETSGLTDETNSVAEIVEENGRIPDSVAAVTGNLLRFQIGHTPEDVRRLATRDFRKANVRLQLRSSGSRDMKRVAAAVGRRFETTPPPMPIGRHWAGHAWLNLAWRQQMARSVLRLLLGLFIVILAAVAIPIAARRRLSRRSRVFSFMMLLSPAAVVLLIMLPFSRMSFSGFTWVGVIAAPILAALNASLLRRRISRMLSAQSTEATAA